MTPSARSSLEMLRSARFWCRSCAAAHKGMFDLAALAPQAWPGPLDHEPIGDLTFERTFLSDDFAFREDGYFFLRCTLDLPVEGMERPFGFGCWAMVRQEDFRAYWDDFDNPDPAPGEPWSGYLANDLKPFPASTNLPCAVHVQPNRKRPKIALTDECHPLARAQRDGLAAADVLAIYRANGHDIGQPALSLARSSP